MVDTRPLLKVGGGKLGWEVPSSIINYLILGNVGSGKSVVAKMVATDVFIYLIIGKQFKRLPIRRHLLIIKCL